VVNPDHPIATVSGTAARDRHGSLGDQRPGLPDRRGSETTTLGEIPIDAIFTAIERVNFVVEHTRVGQAVDFDRLIFEILTNGSIDPEDG